jgi:cell division protease FtsH
MKGLTVLAELLLEKEVIFSEDLERIFGKRKAEVLKDEREAEAKALLPKDAAEIKEEKNGKKSDGSSSVKTKDKSSKKADITGDNSSEKPLKKSKTKSKE